MPNIVPGALWHPIDVGNRAARRKGRGLIGHIAVVNSTLLIPGPLSTRPSDWHFYLPKNPYPTGERFAQLIDLDLQCWSSADGNATCPAFESEGGVGADVGGPWTDNQIEAAAMILAHLHKTEGVPLQDMVNSLPGSRGFGVHRYGIDPYRVPGGESWSKVYAKACPGDARVRQVGAIVARAQQLVNGIGDDDMALTDRLPVTADGKAGTVTVAEALASAWELGRGKAFLNSQVPVMGPDGKATAASISLGTLLAWFDNNMATLRAQNAALLTALQSVAGGEPIDLDAVKAAAQEGAAVALKGGVKVTVDVPGN